MSYNFHIGQEIVALANHSQGVFKKDDVFTVKGLRAAICGCDKYLVNIGLSDTGTSGYGVCTHCGTRTKNENGFFWFSSTRFAPLDSLTNIEELTEILSQPLFQAL